MSTTALLLFLAQGATVAWLASRRGRRPGVWFWLGALLGAIALFALFRERSEIAAHAPDT